ncbi:MAG TPA: hypothetical protein VF230_14725 [Acidimicrobiales bacterium]
MSETRRPVAPRRLQGDDGATLIMALVVLMVLTTLSLGILARTLSVIGGVHRGQDFEAALAVADAGIADALFKIDQTAPVEIRHTAESSGGRYTYLAEKRSDSEYVVTSLAEVGRSRHAAQALVRRSARFPYALWSTQPLHFDGTTATGGMRIGFYSFNQAIGQPDVVRIGSDNAVVCNGPVDPNVYIDEYAGHGDCDTTHLTKLDAPRDMSYQVPPTGQPCPAGGVFGASTADALNPWYLDGKNGTPFLCREDVALEGFIAVRNGPVQIYVLPTVDATGKPVEYHSLDVSGAIVNTLGSATQFQVFKDGPAPIVTGSANTFSTMTFRGVLWAPESRLTINGGLWWAGSVNVNELVVNGSPNLKFGYDHDLSSYLGPDWKVVRYRELPAAEADVVVHPQAPAPTTSAPPPPAPTTTLLPYVTTTTVALPPLPTSTTTTTAPPPTSTSTTSTLPTLPTLPPIGLP